MPTRAMASTGCSSLTTEDVVDARGLKCPLPVLKTEKRLARMQPGERLVVLASDPMAKVDIPLFCRQRQHDCKVSEDGDGLRFTIVKG
jgi:tRNA 2-thiouridine synthesizing protein A